MVTVVLDTNALMLPVERNVRLFDELQRLFEADPRLLIPRSVLAELESLRSGAGKEAKAAQVGRDLADRGEFVEATATYADDAVVEIATTEDAFVATEDRSLRDRLLARGIHVIGIRG
jgi:rRNA-processing protein FCF1